MGRARGRVFPDVTFGAEIEGCGWVDHAWIEAGLPTCHWNSAPAGLATRRQLRELGSSRTSFSSSRRRARSEMLSGGSSPA